MIELINKANKHRCGDGPVPMYKGPPVCMVLGGEALALTYPEIVVNGQKVGPLPGLQERTCRRSGREVLSPLLQDVTMSRTMRGTSARSVTKNGKGVLAAMTLATSMGYGQSAECGDMTSSYRSLEIMFVDGKEYLAYVRDIVFK